MYSDGTPSTPHHSFILSLSKAPLLPLLSPPPLSLSHRVGLLCLVHGDAVHADLDGVAGRTADRALREVQLDGLH